MGKSEVFEFRGVDSLVYAQVLADDSDQFVCGTVKELSPVAEIGRTTATNTETHYYDNQPLIVIDSAGSDELKLTVAPLDLEKLSEITGQEFDAETGSMIEGDREPKYFAIGYRTKGTDGKYRYVWRLKGRFAIPDETNATENEGTDTNNTELTWTGISTVHRFASRNNKRAKAIVTDERYDRVDFDSYFDAVVTPDTLSSLVVSGGLSAPVAYPLATTFDGDSIKVSLVCNDGSATIKYTTNGGNPESGTTYSSPFEIDATTTVKAIAIKGTTKSAVTEKAYVKI